MKPQIMTVFPDPAERPKTRSARPDGPSCGGVEVLEPVTGSVNALSSIESLVLRKLLAEVEARQLTRAQPTYVIEQPPAARNIVSVRILWCLLWAASIAIVVLTIKYVDSQTMLSKSRDSQSRSIETLNAGLAHQHEAFAMIVSSLQQLAGTVASNSKQAEAMPEMLARLGKNLQQSRPPLIKQTPALPVQSPTPTSPETSSPKETLVPIDLGGHNHPPIEWAVTPANVVVHHNSAGTMDYWMVPRTQSGVPMMVKVVPVVQNNSGTLVHHIAEVKDYILTPSGDWIESPKPDGKLRVKN